MDCKYYYVKYIETHEIGMGRGVALTPIPWCEKVDECEKPLLECENCELYEKLYEK